MGPFILFWLIGEGLMIYRSFKLYHAPPLPSSLLMVSGLFVLLAFVAEWQPELSIWLAVGLDVAAFISIAGSHPTSQCDNAGTNKGGQVGSVTGQLSTGTDHFAKINSNTTPSAGVQT